MRDAFEAITGTNPGLLQAAHDLVCGHRSYAGLMRAALVCRCLLAHATVDAATP